MAGDDEPARALPPQEAIPHDMPGVPGSAAWWADYHAVEDEFYTHYADGIDWVIHKLSWARVVAGRDRYPLVTLDPESLAHDAVLVAFRHAYNWRGDSTGQWVSKVSGIGITMATRTFTRRLAQGKEGYTLPLESPLVDSSDETDPAMVPLLRLRARTPELVPLDYGSAHFWAYLTASLDYLADGGDDRLSPVCSESVCELAKLVAADDLRWQAAWKIGLLHLLRERDWPGLRHLLKSRVRRHAVRTLADAAVQGRIGQKHTACQDTAAALGVSEAKAERALAALRAVAESLAALGAQRAALEMA